MFLNYNSNIIVHLTITIDWSWNFLEFQSFEALGNEVHNDVCIHNKSLEDCEFKKF